MKPLKISDLPNVEWKPCSKLCFGMDKFFLTEEEDKCNNCRGHGVEPVEVENESVGYFAETKRKMNKLQVGVPFEVERKVYQGRIGFEVVKEKFLPLYPKVDGDLSVLMVVKVK